MYVILNAKTKGRRPLTISIKEGKMRNKVWLFGLLFFALFSFTAQAAGLNPINGVGARAKGMGGAGIAVADDASIFYYNPALLGDSGNFAQVGGDFLQASFTYKDPKGKQYDSAKSGYFVPLAGVSYKVNQKLAVGLGVVTPNMFGADFKDQMGFYSKMSLTQIAPVIAYQITESLTLGLSLKAGYGQLELSQPTLIAPTVVSRLDSKADGWGYSGQLGILWKATSWLKFGAMYQSKTKVALSGTSNLGPVGSNDFSTDFYFPSYYGVGAGATFGNLLIAFDIIQSDYGSTDKASIDYKTWPKSTLTLDWQNNTSYSLGAEYKLSNWRLRGGLGYQDAVVPDKTINPATPDMNGWTASGGVGYKTKNFGADLAYVHAWGLERAVESSTMGAPGKYSASVDIISMTVSYNF